MPFDIGEAINGIADAFLKAPIVHTVAKNPIYTAITVTLIIILIILIIFRDAELEDNLLVTSLRAGFWIFIILSGALLLHNKVLDRDNIAAEKNTNYDNAFSGAFSGAFSEALIPGTIPSSFEDSIVPVKIDNNFTY